MSDFDYSEGSPRIKFAIIAAIIVVGVLAGTYFLHIGIFATPTVNTNSEHQQQKTEQLTVTENQPPSPPEPVPVQEPEPAPPVVKEQPLKPTTEQIIAKHLANYKIREQLREQAKLAEQKANAAKSTLSTFTTDFYPPATNAIITGSYNNVTNWYYGRAPIATFTAVDDYSGIKRIVVDYRAFNVGCKNYECILKNGDNITLSRQTGVNKGKIELWYYAVDNTNKTESRKKLELWYDGVAPSVYVTKIYSQNRNIPIGSYCNDASQLYQCILIDAKVNETLTFEVLGSDHISGIDKMLYRVVQPLNLNTEWQIAPQDIPQKITVQFDKASNYRLQIKATDIAGNESAVKEFWIRVH